MSDKLKRSKTAKDFLTWKHMIIVLLLRRQLSTVKRSGPMPEFRTKNFDNMYIHICAVHLHVPHFIHCDNAEPLFLNFIDATFPLHGFRFICEFRWFGYLVTRTISNCLYVLNSFGSNDE